MDFKKNQTIYLQIANYICEDILAKNLELGSRIDSVREMAANTQVNPNTIMRTYNYLQEKGIIFNKRGIGYFIAEDALKKTQDIKKAEFIESYLPDLFKTMDLLEISFDDLKEIKKQVQNGSATH